MVAGNEFEISLRRLTLFRFGTRFAAGPKGVARVLDGIEARTRELLYHAGHVDPGHLFHAFGIDCAQKCARNSIQRHLR
jgi:hypothetical protein